MQKIIMLDEKTTLIHVLTKEIAEEITKKGMMPWEDLGVVFTRWRQRDSYCNIQTESDRYWLRIFGLPLHAWTTKVLGGNGRRCVAFRNIDRRTSDFSDTRFARILVTADHYDSFLRWGDAPINGV